MNIAPERQKTHVEAAGYDSAVAHKLHKLWETKPGIVGWLSSVDHKEIGIRYIVTAFLFMGAGGVEALIMRLQLAQPNNTILSPETYNELFSMHGITMILWYAFPVLTGFSVYLQPLLLGTRDMAFPRLNAFTYWVFLFRDFFSTRAFYSALLRTQGGSITSLMPPRPIIRGRTSISTRWRISSSASRQSSGR